jgi:hypothetical protein
LQVQDPGGVITPGAAATIAAVIHIFARTINTTKRDSCRSAADLGIVIPKKLMIVMASKPTRRPAASRPG